MEDFTSYKWTCSCCSDEHIGLPMAYAFVRPDNWNGISDLQRQKGHLDSDFCYFTGDDNHKQFYIRCVLPFPIKDYDAEFEFGVWMSVSEKSFKIYSAGYESEQYEVDGCFGYLMHNIPEFGDTWGLNSSIEFEQNGQRPLVYLHESDHPLVHVQQEGLDLDYIKRLVSQSH